MKLWCETCDGTEVEMICIRPGEPLDDHICPDCRGKGYEEYTRRELISVLTGLSEDDLEFLKELKHELLTQDKVCQAAPRFWVVRGTVKDYGIEDDYDVAGTELIHDAGCIGETLDEAIAYVTENFAEEMGFTAEKTPYGYMITDLHDDDETDIFDLDDLAEYFTDRDVEMHTVNYRSVKKNFENTFFLTIKECEDHIRANHYHYPDDAHTYAMSAWRAPKVSRVWKILETIEVD